MEPFILTDIPVNISTEQVLDKIQARNKPQFASEVEKMLARALTLAKPKAVYNSAFITEKGEDFVIASNQKLQSRVLRVNLDAVHRFFPYVVTCGRELANWAESFSGMLQRFFAEAICEVVLMTAVKYMEEDLEARFRPGHISSMNPGSLGDWPLQEQTKVFAMLGDTSASIGVELTESCLMLPVKSLSGILFTTDHDFKNCMLCPRETCTGRRAPYDRELYGKKYS